MAVNTGLPPGYVINSTHIQQENNGLPPGYVVNNQPKEDALTRLESNPMGLVTEPIKILTGKTAQQWAIDKNNQPNAGTGIPIPNTAPFDRNVGRVGKAAYSSALLGGAADVASSPINYIPIPILEAGGAVLESGIKGAGRYFSKIKATFNPTAIDNLNVSTSARIGNLSDISKNSAQSDIQPLQDSISKLKDSTDQTIQNIGYQSKDLSSASRIAIQDSKRVLKQNLIKLKDDLQNVSEKSAIDFQEKLPEFFQANSEAYGSARDAAIAKMSEQGDGITFKQVGEAIAKTKQDAQAALIPSDAPALKAIEQLEQKYSPKTVGAQSGLLDSSGKPLVKELPNNSNDFVDPNQLIQDLRNVKSALSSGASAGRTGFNQEDLAVGYLDHNLGDFIKAKIPGFSQLQSDYTPVIRSMKQANIIFKPNQGEFNTVTATNFLKKAGTGKLEAGQERLLGTIESGSKFSPGVGNISQPVRQVGEKIRQTLSEGQSNIESLQNNLRNNLNKLEKQKRDLLGSSQSDIARKQDAIQSRQDQLQKRLSELEGRKQEVIKLEANKRVAESIAKAIGGAVSIGGTYEAYKIFKK